MTTRPITFLGQRLELNLDTSAGGMVQIEVQDVTGQPIPGFTLADADILNGNSVRMPVSWKGSPDLSKLAGKSIRLHFKLRNCQLYAFQFQ